MAIDNHLPFLRILAGNTRQQGPAERVQPAAMSMFDLGLAEGSVDLLWCEGAIYVIGFEEGLRQWRPLLADRGCVALTDLCWLRPNPPEIPRAYWAEFYPAIAPTQDRCEAARKAGYQVLSTFVLPESSWWEQCYTPLERRLTELMAEFASDSEALDELHTTQQEIEIYRRYSEYYGYVFFILQKHP